MLCPSELDKLKTMEIISVENFLLRRGRGKIIYTANKHLAYIYDLLSTMPDLSHQVNPKVTDALRSIEDSTVILITNSDLLRGIDYRSAGNGLELLLDQ